jgi:hypothetical protein
MPINIMFELDEHHVFAVLFALIRLQEDQSRWSVISHRPRGSRSQSVSQPASQPGNDAPHQNRIIATHRAASWPGRTGVEDSWRKGRGSNKSSKPAEKKGCMNRGGPWSQRG